MMQSQARTGNTIAMASCREGDVAQTLFLKSKHQFVTQKKQMQNFITASVWLCLKLSREIGKEGEQPKILSVVSAIQFIAEETRGCNTWFRVPKLRNCDNFGCTFICNKYHEKDKEVYNGAMLYI